MGAESLFASGAQTLLGLGQMIFSGKKKAERNLEKYADSYVPNQSIMDYYQKALGKYSANPYTSQTFQNRSNLINRNLSTAINSSQDRRAGIGTLSSLVTGANDATAKAANDAEAEQRANLGILGQATGMKAGEDSKKFDMRYNLLSMKAGGANATQSAGIKNAYGGVSGIADYFGARDEYGDGGTRRNKAASAAGSAARVYI